MIQTPQARYASSATWMNQNPILARGFLAFSTDTSELRIGDGTKRWSQLIPVKGVTGVPSGGVTGQSLVKATDADGDVAWATVSGGGGAGADDVNTILAGQIFGG